MNGLTQGIMNHALMQKEKRTRTPTSTSLEAMEEATVTESLERRIIMKNLKTKRKLNVIKAKATIQLRQQKLEKKSISTRRLQQQLKL